MVLQEATTPTLVDTTMIAAIDSGVGGGGGGGGGGGLQQKAGEEPGNEAIV